MAIYFAAYCTPFGRFTELGACKLFRGAFKIGLAAWATEIVGHVLIVNRDVSALTFHPFSAHWIGKHLNQPSFRRRDEETPGTVRY